MTRWTTEIPTEEGRYWFWGEPHMGQMGSDYTDQREDEPRLLMVEICKMSNGLVGVSGSSFIYLHKFDPKNRAPGVAGYWTPAWVPDTPCDIEGIFKKGKK